MDADSPQSHLVLGVLNAELAKIKGNQNSLTKAKHHFQSMGLTSTECDKMPGRQCMASYFYLMNQFEDAYFYLDSIKEYLEADDDLNWNYGISFAASGKHKEGLETLLKVSKESYKTELEYVLWLVKSHIMTNHPEEAWEVFLQIEDSHISYEILQVIANQCYAKGGEQFLYAAKGFDELLKMDSFPDYVDGLLGACVGYFRHILSTDWQTNGGKLLGVVKILESSALPKGRVIADTIQAWRSTQRSRSGL